MAGPEGFEPPACRLGGGRSIQLSYGPVSGSILARCDVCHRSAGGVEQTEAGAERGRFPSAIHVRPCRAGTKQSRTFKIRAYQANLPQISVAQVGLGEIRRSRRAGRKERLTPPLSLRYFVVMALRETIQKTSWIVVAYAAVLLFCPAAFAEKESHQGDVSDVRVIRRIEQHPYAWRVWQPFIIQGERDRDLIVAFGAMVNGKKDMGDILATISRDDGDTWEEPVKVFDHQRRQGDIQFAYANPVLYRAPSQDVVWCFAMRCLISFENSEESQLVAAFTADGGRTWTPVELAMHYTGPLITNAGIVDTEVDGRKLFLLPAHRNTLQNDPRGSRDHFILSSTSLLEWKIEAYIPQPTRARVFLHEGNMAPGDTPDELKIVMRTANYDDSSLTTDPPRAYSSVSTDGGHTWSVADEEPELHNAKSKAYFGQATDGTHIYVYNDGPAQREPGGRMALRYKTKAPGGSWSEQKTFYDAGIKNSYPTLIEVAPGDFRAVWDSGTPTRPRTHIHFGKLRLEP